MIFASYVFFIWQKYTSLFIVTWEHLSNTGLLKSIFIQFVCVLVSNLRAESNRKLDRHFYARSVQAKPTMDSLSFTLKITLPGITERLENIHMSYFILYCYKDIPK